MKNFWLTLSLLLALTNTMAMAQDSIGHLASSSDIVETLDSSHSHHYIDSSSDEQTPHAHCCHAHCHYFVVSSLAATQRLALVVTRFHDNGAQRRRNIQTPPTPPPRA